MRFISDYRVKLKIKMKVYKAKTIINIYAVNNNN